MEKMQHFSIRKLSIGAASVLIGISFLGVKVSTVKADSLQNTSKAELTKPKAANEAIKQDTSSNIKQEPTSDIKKDTSSNIEQDTSSNIEQEPTSDIKKDTGSNIKQETASKADAKQITNDQPNTAQTPVKPASPKPNSNQQNVADLEAKPQTPAKIKLQTNRTITPNETGQSQVKVTNLMAIAGKKLSPNLLAESKVVTPAKDTNGGFDEATWGTLDVNDWKGSVQGDYYQLTDYTGDGDHVIVPNESDFAKAGISTSGKQVGVTSGLMHIIFRDKTTAQDATVAFSKTDNKQVKAIDANWNNTWGHKYIYDSKAKLSKFDGTNLDVSNVTNMNGMLSLNNITDLSPLANWDVSNVILMGEMFSNNQISDLSPLANWKVDKVTDMHTMFATNQISNLSPLANWKVNQVTNISDMFDSNQISDLSPLANWKVDNVTDMNLMFDSNQISNLSPLANWKVNQVTNISNMFDSNQISDLSPLTNWKVDNVTDMRGMFSNNQISDLSPLANWKVDQVTDMYDMFANNQISDLSPLGKWNVNNVTNMYGMFINNQIKDLSPLGKWNVNNVTNMYGMFANNQISDLSPLSNWNVSKVTDMTGMFYSNQIGDVSPLASWKVDQVIYMNGMFYSNQIGDVSPLASWKVDQVIYMSVMFDNNSSIQTKTTPAKRIIDFVYPAGYIGKKQDTITQTIDVPTQKVNVELTTKESKPSNNILDWVTKTETPISAPIDPVYFQDYTVPAIKGLLEPDQTVIKGQQADITKPINVTVTYKLVESNTNDAFALDSKNGLHEHVNVNDNGGYDEDYWGKINVDNWNYTVNGDTITINGLKDGVSTGTNDAVIVPNLDDFKLAGKDGGAKTVYISGYTLGETAKHKYYGLSKTNGNTFATNSNISSGSAFRNNNNLTHADLNSLNTSKVTDMSWMFYNASSLTSLDVSNWKTGNVTDMSYMFNSASSLTSLDVSNWDTSNVTNMNGLFYGASSLTNLDVSNWDTSNVTNMYAMFNNNPKLDLIVNGDKFADYLVKNNFAESRINSSVKSVTTDNPKLLKLLTNDSQHNSAIRTIALMLPVGYNPDLVKYHLIKVGNTYQIKQSVDYDKPYVQGTVLINVTDDITKHHIDTTKPNKLTDTWQPNYNKLVLAHKNNDGTVSFDAVQLPKVPGYKAVIRYESPKVADAINPRTMLFRVSYITIPEKPIEPTVKPIKSTATTPIKPTVKPIESTAKPDEPTAITPIKPTVKLDKPDVTPSKPDVQDHLSDHNTQTPVTVADDAVVSRNVDSVDFDWKIATKMGFDNGKRQAVAFEVSNSDYSLNLPYVNNSKLYLVKQYTTKDAVSFAYVGQNSEYVFNIKFVNGHYLLTTYKIKSGKLVKLIDYNFVKSSKMIEVILDWLH